MKYRSIILLVVVLSTAVLDSFSQKIVEPIELFLSDKKLSCYPDSTFFVPFEIFRNSPHAIGEPEFRYDNTTLPEGVTIGILPIEGNPNVFTLQIQISKEPNFENFELTLKAKVANYRTEESLRLKVKPLPYYLEQSGVN